jgi:hypothetical protein
LVVDSTKSNEVTLRPNELNALRDFYMAINEFAKPLIFNK